MFAYWLMNLLKAAKNQESLTAIIIQKGIIVRSIHHFHYQQGMLLIGAINFNTGGFKRTESIMTGMNNYITVSG